MEDYSVTSTPKVVYLRRSVFVWYLSQVIIKED